MTPKLDKDVRDMLPHEKLMASAYGMAWMLKECRKWLARYALSYDSPSAAELVRKIDEQLKRSGME